MLEKKDWTVLNLSVHCNNYIFIYFLKKSWASLCVLVENTKKYSKIVERDVLGLITPAECLSSICEIVKIRHGNCFST